MCNIGNWYYRDDVNLQPTCFENSFLYILTFVPFTKTLTQCINFLQSLNFLPDIVCLFGTRIKDEPLADISITSYSFIHIKSHSTAEGVVVYILTKLKFEMLKNQFTLYNSESLWLTIYTKNCTVNIEVMYHHPSLTNIYKFLEDLSTGLSHFSSNYKTLYLLGDLNINLHKFN